jgi:hypothetical protein
MTEGPRGAVASPPTPFLPTPPAPSLVPLGAQDQPPRDTRAAAHARAGTETVTAAGRKKGEENSDPAGKPKRQNGRGWSYHILGTDVVTAAVGWEVEYISFSSHTADIMVFLYACCGSHVA